MQLIYNSIGVNYAEKRRPDGRLAALIRGQIGDLENVLNVGAGTGSYEPGDVELLALEPSIKMISQRHPGAAPCICGVAEYLPFPDNSFAVVMALLTLHHWRDIDRGLDELQRVASRRIVIHTWDYSACADYWLINDYIPELMDFDARRFPAIAEITCRFAAARVIKVMISHDFCDGFQGAYWRRPEAYLDSLVKDGISSFQQISQTALNRGLTNLKADLDSGAWHRRYNGLLDKQEIDLGYRLIVADI